MYIRQIFKIQRKIFKLWDNNYDGKRFKRTARWKENIYFMSRNCCINEFNVKSYETTTRCTQTLIWEKSAKVIEKFSHLESIQDRKEPKFWALQSVQIPVRAVTLVKGKMKSARSMLDHWSQRGGERKTKDNEVKVYN